ncbi:multidrug resistance-associated protein 5 [Tanacetum coccineum]
MTPGTDMYCFDVHNDAYFSQLPLTYVNGVILEMVVRRMPYEQFAEYLEENMETTFKVWYRKIIALDGCFLKSLNQGEILTTIGRDGNNHIYPVAWVVVNVENKDNWTWFLELLEQDLGSSRGNGLTMMSDQHKGLMEVVKDVMPNAKHKQCARHIYKNFRKQYSGLEFRQLFWAASKALYPLLFNKIMDKIKSANLNAHKYLMDKNPKTWSRASFEVDRGCEAIENGFSECFNSVIVSVRHKLLLTMLEAIRVIHVIHTGGNIFGVRSESDRFTVDEVKWTCSCRMWQLSRIPCVHATKFLKEKNQILGVGGSSTRVPKVGSQVSCSNPKKHEHNKASCKEPILEQTPKPKGVLGRPRKNQSVVNLKDAGGSRGGAGGSREGAGRSRGGASRSKRKAVSSAGTQKRQGKKKVGTSGFAKWFGLQDELEQTQDELEQTQDEPVQTQDEDQVEQTQEQAEIDLT